MFWGDVKKEKYIPTPGQDDIGDRDSILVQAIKRQQIEQ